jgi:hypothetical protein
MLWFDPQTASLAVPGGSLLELFKGLGPALIGLIGTVVTIAGSTLKDHSDSIKRVREIDEAAKVVSFWKTWLEAACSLGTEDEQKLWREKAKKDLEKASARVEGLFPETQSESHLSAKQENFVGWRRGLPTWRRWLLLYKPPRARAWLPRVIFYLYLVVGPVAVISNAYSELATPFSVRQTEAREAQSDSKIQQYIADARTRTPFFLLGLGIGEVVNLGLALLFRAWSVHLENPE